MRQERSSAGYVLLVEAHADFRETLCGVLHERGYRVTAARDSQEALAYLCAGRVPGVILVDRAQAARELRAFCRQQRDTRLAGIPVLFLSSPGDSGHRRGTPEVSGYFAKPVDMRALLAAVAQHAGRPAVARALSANA